MTSNKLSCAYKRLLDTQAASFEEREVGEEHEHAIDAMLLVPVSEQNAYEDTSESASKKPKIDQEKLKATLKKASEGVVVAKTLQEYERWWTNFKNFCVKIEIVNKAHKIEEMLRVRPLPADLPKWIAIWIMDKCDETDVFTNKIKDLGISRATYGTAQKMRAAMSHKFGRELELGSEPWTENPAKEGEFVGNPSLSVQLSQYMVSLRRRKVRAGEVVTSARAINEEDLKQIYEYDMRLTAGEKLTGKKKREDNDLRDWANADVRSMLRCVYLIAFLCLLRFDEALNIQWEDITIAEWDENSLSVRLSLPFRKTHQSGNIAPFYLYPDNTKPWLCPILAISDWRVRLLRCGSKASGYIFRKRMGKDKLSIRPEEGLKPSSFMECFRNHLLDININPEPYGTHSFRRGGCQYLAQVKRWPFRAICDWAGWAENFDNPGTLFKYLLSWNDVAMDRREYMNPKRQPAALCTACGRKCHCA